MRRRALLVAVLAPLAFAPSALAGVHLRLLIFELTTEAGGTVIKYRDGTQKTVATSAVSLAMHIAI